MTVVPQGQNRLFSFHASSHMACLSSVLLTGPWLSTHCLTLILWICLRLYWGRFIPDRNWFCLYQIQWPVPNRKHLRPLQNARISVDLRVSLSILQLIQDPINLVRSAISVFLGGKSSPLPTHLCHQETLDGRKRHLFWRPFLPLEIPMLHRVSSPWCHLQGCSQRAPI